MRRRISKTLIARISICILAVLIMVPSAFALEQVTLEGEFGIILAAFDQGSGIADYYLTVIDKDTGDKDMIFLTIAPALLQGLELGMMLRVSGVLDGIYLGVETVEILSTIEERTALMPMEAAGAVEPAAGAVWEGVGTPGSSPWRYGIHSTLVVVGNFTDATSIGVAAARARVFDDARSISNYYGQVSRGILEFTGDVYGPYALAIDSSVTYQTAGNALKTAFEADTGLSVGDYQHVLYVIPQPDFPSPIGLGTVGNLNSSSTTMWIWDNAGVASSFVHEMGHNIGMNHTYLGATEYGDVSCMMGYSNLSTYNYLNAPHIYQMGWMVSSCTQTVSYGQYDIESLAVDSDELKVLRVDVPADPYDHYISYRAGAVGLDVGLHANFRYLTYVHQFAGGINETFLEPANKIALGGNSSVDADLQVISLRVNGDMNTVQLVDPNGNQPPDAGVDKEFFCVGGAVAVNLAYSDPEDDALSLNWIQAPTNGYFLGTAPNLIYTNSSGSSQMENLVYRVNDGQYDSFDVSVTIYMHSPPVLLSMSATPSTFDISDDPASCTVSAYDPEDAELSFQWAAAGGAGKTVFTDAQSSNTFCVIDMPGTYELSVDVMDSTFTVSATQTVTFTVSTNAHSVVAFDGFESADYEGGYGFGSAWETTNPDKVDFDTNNVYAGSYHMKHRRNESLTRYLSMVGCTNSILALSWKATGFDDTNDYGLVEFYDGSWHTLRTIEDGEDDDTYRRTYYSLNGYDMNDNCALRLTIVGNAENDITYCDDVTVLAMPDPAVDRPPFADAGQNIVVVDSNSNGTENIVLDGSGSFGYFGKPIVSYLWLMDGVTAGTASILNVDLSPGMYTVDLVVTDDQAISATARVSVAVLPPNVIAWDDFESGVASGGQGWVGNWSFSATNEGGGSVTSYGNAKNGDYHMDVSALSRSVRTIDLSAVTNRAVLEFWWKADRFEAGDNVDVQIRDGVTHHPFYINDGDDDGVYHFKTIDISGYNMTNTFKIYIDGNAGSNDYFYIDNIVVRETDAVDSDNDGMLDDLDLDDDDDGMSDVNELIAGTDPLDSGSYFRIERIEVSGGEAGVEFFGVSNRNYVLEFCYELPATNWTTVPGGPASGSNTVMRLNHSGTDETTKFYRLSVSE